MTPTTHQLQAIESIAPVTFAVAGPGSGKTRTLVWRVLHLIADGVPPEYITCITFTNAAAREMQQRLGNVRLGFIGTLHSFMLDLIRRNGRALGWSSTVSVMDEEESAEFLEEMIEKHRYRGTKTALLEAITSGPKTVTGNITRERLVAGDYWNTLRQQRRITFDGILIVGEMLLALCPVAPCQWMIDECQDSNPIDFRIYDLLKGTKFFSGDPDQSIYAFRGADVSLCLTLSRRNDCVTVPLEENFRSAPAICHVANKLIQHNHGRYDKQTKSAVDYENAAVIGQCFDSPPIEASAIAQDIAMRVAHSEGDMKECAILVRTNLLVEEFTNHIRAAGLPVAYSRRPERPKDWPLVRKYLAYVQNPDNDYACYRWIETIVSKSRADVLRDESAKMCVSINDRYGLIAPIDNLGLLSKYLPPLSRDSETLLRDTMATLPESATIGDLMAELSRLDEHIIGEGVTVSTIHAAKGREWDYVYLPAFEQQIIPSERKTLDIEEERRLAYVAVTRARRGLFVSWCKQRFVPYSGHPGPIPVRPSQFVAEMGISPL
jgi:DNA helicase-2/ATP-dependent DNA helicase PcrA